MTVELGSVAALKENSCTAAAAATGSTIACLLNPRSAAFRHVPLALLIAKKRRRRRRKKKEKTLLSSFHSIEKKIREESGGAIQSHNSHGHFIFHFFTRD